MIYLLSMRNKIAANRRDRAPFLIIRRNDENWDGHAIWHKRDFPDY